ncbi:hypothetical protein [Streptomyces sp. uw30]|uniref:hypothetical protein n=1 Tax=Streptomyces sp. uw30 TaxID=1828179 RepID=UPI0016512178|nr:hypothetical protein [Streptomyces sp. uw30]
MKADDEPECLACGGPFRGSWRLGRAVGQSNPYVCGLPRQKGCPCGWNTVQEPRPYHPTPGALGREEERKQEEQERRGQAEEQRRSESERLRQNVIPEGIVVRTLHLGRRRLAGVKDPGSFVLEATNFSTRTLRSRPSTPTCARC